MDAAVDIGSNPVSKHQTQPECVEWAGWHETGRPNLSHETKSSGVNGNKDFFSWSADHVNRIGNLPFDLYSAICDDNNNNNNNCCSVDPQLPPVIGAPWGYCGRGFLLPVDYGSVGL